MIYFPKALTQCILDFRVVIAPVMSLKWVRRTRGKKLNVCKPWNGRWAEKRLQQQAYSKIWQETLFSNAKARKGELGKYLKCISLCL